MPPLNVALVGFGFAGQTFHAPLISACPDLRLHTVVTSKPADLASAWPGAKPVATLDEALADPAVDLVVIATPDAVHAAQSEQALHSGKAVVVDKPFALNLSDAARLVDLAKAKNLLLSVFQNRRWDADFLALQAEIASGRLGRIVTCESHFDRYRPVVRDRWREAAGAGVWFDLGPHLIDQALVLFGRPLGVTLDLAIHRDGGLSPDWAHAILRYEHARVVLNAAMLIAAPDIRFAVHGSKASWLSSGLDPQEDQLKAGLAVGADGWGVDPKPATFVDGDTGVRTPAPGPAGNYPAYYAGIAAALRRTGPNPVPPEQALEVMQVLEAGVESDRLRREIALPPR
ncbi:oxidoreductase [soil metagenome]